MATGNWNNTSRRTIVGYFSDGDKAHRAIDELISVGFRPAEIGAAFRSAGSAKSAKPNSLNETSSEDLEFHPEVGLNSPQGGTSIAGAGSDSNAVTPAGLSTGGGTAFSGATKPGPIPGSGIPSSIPSSLPHSLQSTLPSSLQPADAEDIGNTSSQAAGIGPATGGFHENRSAFPNWWEKLKHVFGGESQPVGVQRTSSTDHSVSSFGTGEGHLGSYQEYDYAYSGAGFESAFFGMGVAPARAKQLSLRIHSGGAIVTVDSAERSDEAEGILERNGGSIRDEDTSEVSSVNAWGSSGEQDRVQLFGQVQRVYPGYVSSTGAPTRKAS